MADDQNKIEAIKKFTIWWRYSESCSMRDLAKELGVTTQTIYYWLKGTPVPIKYLKRIEELSGGIYTKEMIRPDIFH